MKSIGMKSMLLVSLLGSIICELSAQDYETVRSIELASSPVRSYYVNDYAILRSGVRVKGTSGTFFIKTNPSKAGAMFGGLNYVRTEQYRKAISNERIKETLTPDERALNYKYIDGLGTQIQTVDASASPGKRDVVTFNVFDNHGREPKAFLPFTINGTGAYRIEAEKEQLTFYAGTPGVVVDKEPYHLNSFEESPLNRLNESYAPGWAWHTDAQSIPQTNTFDANTAKEVFLLRYVAGIPEYSATRFYPANSLTRSMTTLESGLVQKTYRDIKGRVICEKKGAGNEWHETYFIYDVNGFLRFVFPPEASARLAEYAASSKKQTFLDQWVFQYRYDDKGRTTEKRVPGSDWIHMIYDQWDRLVLTQDGRQRPSKEWTFTKYDVHNRPIITGTVTGTRTSLETGASNGTIRFETRAANAIGYTNNSFPAHTESRVLTIKYYDCYNFINYPNWDADKLSYLPFDEPGIVAKNEVINPGSTALSFDPVVRGYETGSKTRVLNSNTWLHKVVYYDRKYRPVQTISKNSFGKRETISSARNAFTGKIEKRKRVHNGPAGVTTIYEELVYDHRDRLLQTWHQINDNPKTLLTSLRYNELGQLIEKNIHSVDGSSFIQSIDYAYNIQGWLTGVNQVTSAASGTDPVADLFGMEAMFETAPTVAGNSARKYFDGRISAISWKAEVPKKNEARIYAFDYDNFGRFHKSTFASRIKNAWTGAPGMFDEQVTSYDRNGNIGGGSSAAIIRYGMIEGTKTKIDELTYRYEGNRLQNVKDQSIHPAGFSDKPGVATSVNEFGYDPHGNLISDQNKSITKITYNALNLPEEIEITRADLNPVRTDRIRFSYDAEGNRLSREILVGGNEVWKTIYSGDFQYDNGELSFIETSEGRAVPNGSSFDYEYFFRDHQGNVRAVYGVVEETAVYKATMEPALDNQERVTYGFSKITETRTQGNNITVSSPEVFSPAYSARCNGYTVGTSATPVGPSKSFSVRTGEAVYVEVFARYNSARTTSSKIVASTLVSAVTSSFNVTSAENYKLYQNMSTALPVTSGNIAESSVVPKAYLMLLFFDNNYVFRKAAAQAVSQRAYKQFEKLSISFTPEANGYVYIYVINESNESALLDVYFDDLYIIHQKRTRTPRILQSVDYYPFGLTFNLYHADRLRSIATENGVRYEPVLRNRVLFQGQEHQNDLGLGWYQYRYRMHDPAIGRFGSVDPLAEDYKHNSPYAFSENALAQGRELEGLEKAAYEVLKYISPISFTVNSSFTTHESKIGVEVSIGIPKLIPFSYRKTFGTSYVSRDYFSSEGEMEHRVGTETTNPLGISFQSTKYIRGGLSQTTGLMTLGGPFFNLKYENDWWDKSTMALLDPLKLHPAYGGDGGDRFRTAAGKFTFGVIQYGFNLATGDPGPIGHRSHDYTLGGINGTYVKHYFDGQEYDPDKYRLGLKYVGLGPWRLGINNELFRHRLQNRFAHEFLLKNDPSARFLLLPGNDELYFGLSTGGGTAWP